MVGFSEILLERSLFAQVQGIVEDRIEPYLQYGEGGPETITKKLSKPERLAAGL